MQSIPLPKVVVNKLEAICRSFLWTRGDKISRKALVVWEKSCKPKNQGGLNIMCLNTRRKVSILKMLWNICRKADNLWVKWIHCYYIYKERFNDECPGES